MLFDLVHALGILIIHVSQSIKELQICAQVFGLDHLFYNREMNWFNLLD